MKFLLTLALLTAFLSAGTPNPRLADLPDNAWMVLDSSAPQLLGNNYFAYSGGAYDRVNHQFLVFGGGHFDGYKNDVLAFDIASTTWRSMYASDPLSDYACDNLDTLRPGMLIRSGLPGARHTYDQIKFMDHLGKMVIWSNALYASVWGCFMDSGATGYSPYAIAPRDTWLYDYAANTWEYKNETHAPQPLQHGCGAYDPAGQRLYALSEKAETWFYDDSADVWTRLNPSGTVPSGYCRVMIADRNRRRLWVWPDVYDIMENSWSRMSGGPAVNEGSYDEANDALVYCRGGQVLVYDPASGAWDSTLAPSGPAPVYTPSSADPYGRFFYDPVDNVHLLVQRVNYRPKTWAYRYKRAPAKTELAQVKKAAALRLFPNPARTAVRVEGAQGQVGVFDIKGRMMMKGDNTLDVSGLANGLYVVRAAAGGASSSKRLLIER